MEKAFNRVEVRTIGRQEKELASCAFYGVAHAFRLMSWRLIHDDDIPWEHCRDEDLFDIGTKCRAGRCRTRLALRPMPATGDVLAA